MRLKAIALCVLACAWTVSTARAGGDLDAFLQRDAFGTIKVSPDGRHYAATMPMGDRTGMVIIDRKERSFVSKATGGVGSAVADFWWIDDARVVIAMAETEGSEAMPYVTGDLFVFDVDGNKARNIFGRQVDPGMTDRYGPATQRRDMATLIDPLVDAPGEVLVAVAPLNSTPHTRVERLHMQSRQTRVIATAPVSRAHFTVDAGAHVRFAEGADERNYRKLFYRVDDDADWQLVNDETSSGQVVSAIGLSAAGDVAYLRVQQGSGPDAIEVLDVATLERKPLLRDAHVDPYAVLYDRDGRTPIGVQYMDEGVRNRFFDEASPMARTYRALEKSMPGSAIDFTSFSRDGNLGVLRVRSDRVRGDYALFDMAARRADGIFRSHEWLSPDDLPRTARIELRARDGVALQGYLTRPPAWTSGAMPMVIVPHGGPFGVFDEWTYDAETQLLAAAGYAVLRVNFRGSGNFGRAFRQLGAREWGGTMQDDLTDATRWAIDEGVADPARVCIYGASYGGYAALMGVARDPGLYRCAAGYVGVYDLEAKHASNSRYADWARHWSNDWMGSRSSLEARSPVTLAGSIKVPVFLAAGGADPVAPLSHSRQMERALRRADVPVQTLYYDSEGHGFVDDAHRREFYARLLDFLADHIGGERADPADVAQAQSRSGAPSGNSGR
ncbi:S9 family peptidase [Lysobacter spongiae]|uniref:S9 family peptidase n=1 Tax=Marilutibacter spongiae TaxID=2025720 RepID=A0A7W3TMY7_9GAMM|nr:S9 family peptidase [Lysobacter spongiae]